MFKDNLLQLRKLKNMTQEDIADKVGVSRQAVAKWESECQGDGSLDNYLFIVYTVPEVIHHAEKSQNAE